MEIPTKSEKETYNCAKKFADNLKGGEVIGLIGDLGAGKTVFARGLAAGLGVKQKITSPTFVLMKNYPARSGQIKELIHIDAYRLKSASGLTAVGADEFFNRPDTVVLIEWANRVKKLLPNKSICVKITNKGESIRILTIKPAKIAEKKLWEKYQRK